MKTPYVGFSNSTLDGLPSVSVGDEIACQLCGGKHKLEPADDGSVTLLFYICGNAAYLGAINGRSIVSAASDVSGSYVSPVREKHRMESFADGSAVITVTCCECGESQQVHMKTRDYDRWQSGETAQKAFPYLDANQREILISGVCGKCFDRMFAEEE